MSGAGKELIGPFTLDDLKDVFLFLDAGEIGTFCSYLEFQEWAEDKVLMRDGAPADFMAFLVEGKLAVKKETLFPGRYILVAVIERGSMVGEISVVEPGSRSATVVTAAKSKLLVLTRAQMEKMLVRENALAVKLLKRIIHVLGHRLHRASERLSRLL